MSADRMDADREHLRNLLASQSPVDQAQDLPLPGGEDLYVALLRQFGHLSIGGVHDQALGLKIKQQRAVKTQRQPKRPVDGGRNIKHPVQDGNVAVCTASDAEFARQIIIIAFIPGLSFDKMEETELLPVLFRQVVRVNEPEDLLFPDGRNNLFSVAFVHSQRLREPAIIQVAGIAAQVAQYGNGIFHAGIITGNQPVTVQHLRTGRHFVEVLGGEFLIQDLYRVHLSTEMVIYKHCAVSDNTLPLQR